MAVVSTSLVSQLSGSKSAMSSSSSPPQFSGLRRSSHNLKLDQSHSLSSTLFFFQQVHSHLRLSAGRPSCRGVVTMGASGKFFVGGNWKCDLTTKKMLGRDCRVGGLYLFEDNAPSVACLGTLTPHQVHCRVEQLKDIGCKWVILGHSKRRHVIGEDDQFIGNKAAYALSQDLKVIACIGEKFEEREAGKTFNVCFQQMKAFSDIVPSWDDGVIAYEPVWAIGTGKVATPQQAQEVHVAVRDWLRRMSQKKLLLKHVSSMEKGL